MTRKSHRGRGDAGLALTIRAYDMRDGELGGHAACSQTRVSWFWVLLMAVTRAWCCRKSS